MCRPLALAAALLALTAPAGAMAQGTHGVVVGLGYGLHRYFNGGLEAQDYNATRAFDGYYVEASVGYQAKWGGLIALDWAHSEGSNAVRLDDSELDLRLRAETLSVLVGGEWGPGRWVRFHVGVVAGAAVGQFERTFTLGGVTSTHDSTVVRPSLGAQAGLDVLPVAWMEMGLRVRGSFTFRASSDAETANIGGFYLGLNAAVML